MNSHHYTFAGAVSRRPLLSAVGAGLILSLSAGSALAADEGATVSVDAVGHWHVFDAKTLSFTVTDIGPNGPAELNPVVEITRVGSDRVTVLTDDKVTAEGDGKYAAEYTPSTIGSYAMVVKVAVADQMAVSSPIAFEVARAGDEGIKASAQGTDYVYQIRYNWNPGHIHASPTEPAKLVFELMRGIQQGAEIDWDKPWQNSFDHVSGSTEMTALLTSKDGTVSDTLNGTYKGKGIYEASRVFNPEEVGHEREYSVQLSFVDPFNGARVESPRAYGLRAVEGH